MPAGGIEVADLEEEVAKANAEKHAVYFVLEGANLEVAKVGKGYDLLNSDDHLNFLRKHGKDPGQYRPDITHQVGRIVDPCCMCVGLPYVLWSATISVRPRS